MRAITTLVLSCLGCLTLFTPATAQTPVGTAFTYQGRLTDNGVPAGGAYDFRFILMDADAGGSQVGPTLLRDEVTVSGGLFTVWLDFGAVFTGSKRFLEVAARPGSSTGSYTAMGSRQELTPAPYSLQAASSTTVGGLSCTNGQVLKWSAGVWTCAADAVGSGTVTSVGSGAGLTGGPITGSGSLSIDKGGVTSIMVANGAIGLAQINQAQVQARVGETCPSGRYLAGINPDGSVLCEPFLAPPAITILEDSANRVGLYTAIAIGSDNLPVISYMDFTAYTLKVAHCGNAHCTSGNTVVTLDDPANLVGAYTSIAILPTGGLVISFQDLTAGALKMANCSNATCTGLNVISTVDDSASQVGYYTSIAIGNDDLPVISYADLTADALKVAHCGDSRCSAGNTLTTVDNPANVVGYYTSIAIGNDDFPIISYQDDTAGALKVAHCGNAACSSGNTITTVDNPANTVGAFTSIAIGTDGLPVISYHDDTAGALKVAHCGNVSCSSGNTITTVDSSPNDVGSSNSIAIGTDGLPIVSYHDATAMTLKVAHCGNASCSSGNTISVVDDPANEVGWYTSIAIGSDGLPVISYHDITAEALKVLVCGTRTCQ